MDGYSTDVVRKHLHLTGVNPDPEPDSEAAHPVTYCHGGA